MKVLIIEDEPLAAERLLLLLKQYDPEVEVGGVCSGIEQTVQWLSKHAHPDVLFLDIHLSDGYCFEIFNQVEFVNPVIFTTAYTQYSINAFELYSFAYLLKPVSIESLAKAMQKIHKFSGKGTSNYLELSDKLEEETFRTRILGKSGSKMYFVSTSAIEYFEANDKIIHVIHTDGRKLIVDSTLDKMEQQLNPSDFFRLNRSHIVRLDAIQYVKPYDNGRLELVLAPGGKEQSLIVSREKVQLFKRWANV